MKKIIIVLLAVLAMVGCSNSGDKEQFISSASTTILGNGATLTAITVQPGNASIAQSTTQSYTATGVYSDNSTQDITNSVTWSTGTPSIATNNGKVVTGVSVGTSTVVATLDTISGQANLNVTNATLNSITLEWVSGMGVGTTMQLVALGHFSDGSVQDITTLATWSSGSTGVASVSNNDGSKGLATGAGAGSSTITAQWNGKQATRPLNVTAATLTSLSIGGDATIPKGTNKYYNAIATYSDGTTQDVSTNVTWATSSSSVATIALNGTINAVAHGASQGTSVISASLNGVSASANLTVNAASVVSLAITGNSTVAKGSTIPLKAIATLSDGSTLDVTNSVSWLTNSSSIATISNLHGTNGTTYGISEGGFVVTASLGGVSATANLTVTAATLVSINIGSNFSVTAGSTTGLTATGTYSDGSTQNITSLVTWASSSTPNATVSNNTGSNGTVHGIAIGTANITASLGSVNSNTAIATVTAPPTAQTSTAAVGGYDITVPNTMTVVQPGPTGDFTGITFQGNPSEIAGFVSTVQYGGAAGCTAFGATLLNAMINDTPNYIITNNQISTSTIGTNPNCSVVYNLAVTTNTSLTVSGLSNHLIDEIGKAVPGGTVSNLPVAAGSEQAGTTFRVILQATYSSTGNELVGIGISREDNYASNAATINSLLDGTNILPAGSSKVSKLDAFVGAADPKVDFVWVVDNSSSMTQEQNTVKDNAVTFFNSLNGKHLDFRLGVLATGSNGTDKCTINASGEKGWELWGTSQDSSKWVYKNDTNAADTFKNNVGVVGIAGCGTETSIFHAQRALGAGPNPVTATVTPRAGAKLIFVALTDEGEFYSGLDSTWNGKGSKAAYLADNIFVANNYKWYGIMGLNASNQPGACTYGSLAGQSNSGTDTALYELIQATGGAAATICASSYAAILDNIATQAAASSSSYVLSQNPISSSIIVKVNGATVAQDSSNGWQYNASANSIVFSGTAWPAEGANIEVSYQYVTSVAMGKSEDSKLTAFLFQASGNKSVKIGLGVILLAGLALAGRRLFKKLD